jgi:hypothetical protein
MKNDIELTSGMCLGKYKAPGVANKQKPEL